MRVANPCGRSRWDHLAKTIAVQDLAARQRSTEIASTLFPRMATLVCLMVGDGKVVWRRNILRDFAGETSVG